jgi:hypothetical protein
MKYSAAIILLFLCLTSATLYVATQETIDTPVSQAKIVLVAPTSARIGELVRLDVSESNAESFKWLLVPDSVDFLVFDSGRRAVFSGREAGVYQIIVGCAKGNTVDFILHTIRVTGPPEVPASGNFAELIPYWMWSYPFPTEECTALADSFEEVAARTTLLTPGDWIKATAEANRTVLGSRTEEWGIILDKIGAELLRKAEAGELLTPEDHKKVWLEIAEGLRSC